MVKTHTPSFVKLGAFIKGSFFVKLGAVSLAFSIHGLVVFLIYYGGSFIYSAPQQRENIVYDPVEFFKEESHSLNWVAGADEATEESFKTTEKDSALINNRDYSYKSGESYKNLTAQTTADAFIKLYESEGDFLLEKQAYQNKILTYAQDITPQNILSQNPKALKNKKKVAQKKSANSHKKQKVSQGKKQSAYCQLPSVVSAQKAQKPAHIKLLISRNGRVKKATLTRSSGLRSFDKAALRLAHQAKCRPEVIKGVAQNAYVNLRISAS